MQSAGIDSAPARKRHILWLEVAFFAPFSLAPMLVVLTQADRLTRVEIIYSIYMSVLLSALIAYFTRFARALRIFIYTFLALGSLALTNILLFWGRAPNSSVMLAVIDTSQTEAIEFLLSRTSLNWKAIVLNCLVVILPLGAMLLQRKYKLYWLVSGKTVGILLALFPLVFLSNLLRLKDLSLGKKIERVLAQFPENLLISYPPAQPYLALVAAIKARQELSLIAAATGPVEGTVRLRPATEGPRSYVIVIGEFLSPAHMHLYGYNRPTTPRFDALADQNDITVFRDVVTSHVYTIGALSAALTLPIGADNTRRTIVDVFNSAGFKTYWLSNQYKVGIFDSGLGRLFKSAQSQVWLNPPLNLTTNMTKQRYDEDLLVPLKSALAEDAHDKVIFVHLVGSHEDYQYRYPKTFKTLPVWNRPCLPHDQARILDDYDNSVSYNDFVVGEIIEMVRGSLGESFVLYFSDHGEEVYDFRFFHGRERGWISPFMLNVPLLLWMSPEFALRRRELTSLLPSASARPYSTGDLSYAIADLAGVTFPGMDVSRSLFHPKFSPRRRMSEGLPVAGGGPLKSDSGRDVLDIDAFIREWRPDAAHASGIPLITCDRLSGVP